jgi:hypothetical protein
MQKLAETTAFTEKQNIVLKGFDPVSAGGFTQVPNCIINSQDLSASAKLVYAKLLSYAWYNDQVYPGQERMATDIGMGLRTVNGAVAELQKQGYLEVQRRGLGLTNIYILYHSVRKRS